MPCRGGVEQPSIGAEVAGLLHACAHTLLYCPMCHVLSQCVHPHVPYSTRGGVEQLSKALRLRQPLVEELLEVFYVHSRDDSGVDK